uniref:hypothetical protein n=1 Tax=uncultured Halomonas sp. TaxID=173971 RepID=UPI0026059E37|nr:hypothetical protein [uncultured Halomonas sp.]
MLTQVVAITVPEIKKTFSFNQLKKQMSRPTRRRRAMAAARRALCHREATQQGRLYKNSLFSSRYDVAKQQQGGFRKAWHGDIRDQPSGLSNTLDLRA